MLFNVLGRLKQKVILKWTPEGVVKLPPNVKIGSWFPQNDILGIQLTINIKCKHKLI